jgi:hypothetical protein
MTSGFVPKVAAAACVCAAFLLFGTAYKERVRKLALPILGGWGGTLAVVLLSLASLGLSSSARTVEIQAAPDRATEVTLKWGGGDKQVSAEAKNRSGLCVLLGHWPTTTATSGSDTSSRQKWIESIRMTAALRLCGTLARKAIPKEQLISWDLTPGTDSGSERIGVLTSAMEPHGVTMTSTTV